MIEVPAVFQPRNQQRVFRLLLDAMARPGTVADLSPWTGGKPAFQPVPPPRIKAMYVNIVRAITLRLSIVQHDYLEWDGRHRHKAVTGKIASNGGIN